MNLLEYKINEIPHFRIPSILNKVFPSARFLKLQLLRDLIGKRNEKNRELN